MTRISIKKREPSKCGGRDWGVCGWVGEGGLEFPLEAVKSGMRTKLSSYCNEFPSSEMTLATKVKAFASIFNQIS